MTNDDEFIGSLSGRLADLAGTVDAASDLRARIGRRHRRLRARRVAASVALSLVVVAGVSVVAVRALSGPEAQRLSTMTGTAPSGVLPSPRTGAAMAYDDRSRQLVLFGGTGPYGASLGDTWTWDGQSWQKQFPPHSPPALSRALMGYDPASRTVVLTGGQQDEPLSDPCQRPAEGPVTCQPQDASRTVRTTPSAWEWTGTDWHQLSLPAAAVATAAQPTLITDEASQELLMIGGGSTTTTTSVWTSAGWHLLAPAHQPPAGYLIGAFDPAAKAVIAAIQPQSANPGPNDPRPLPPVQTWEWSGSDWRHLSPQTEPVLFGSYDTTLAATDPHSAVFIAGTGDIWEWESSNWVRQKPDAAPPIYQGAALATDDATGQAVLIGGYRKPQMPGPIADESIWNGTGWAATLLPVTASPTPAAPADYSCFTNSPLTIYESQRPGGAVTLKATALVSGPPPCHFQLNLRISIADASGRLLPIAGNPVTVSLNENVPASPTSVAGLQDGWTWTNLCGTPASDLEVLVQASGVSLNKTLIPVSPQTLSAAPACQYRSEPSTIRSTTSPSVTAVP